MVVGVELWWCDMSVCGGCIDLPSLHVNTNILVTLILSLLFSTLYV